MTRTRSPRARLVALLMFAAATLALVTGTGTAGATLPGTPVGPNMNAIGGLVTGGGQPDRTLSSDQAAAFTQAWTPIAIYGNPELEIPPADTPTYTVSVDYVAEDASGAEGSDTIVVNLATDGVSSWIALPEQELFSSFSVAADQANRWFKGNQLVIDAFNGNLQPEPVNQPSESTTTLQPADTASSGSSPVLLIAVIVVAAAVAIGAVLIGSRRRNPRT